MGLIKKIAASKLFVDTAPLIYFIEEHPKYVHILDELFVSNKHSFAFLTSVVTLAEVLVLPLKEERTELAQKYEKILTKANSMELLDINAEIARITAQLRAKNNVRTPDAINSNSYL